MKRVIIETPYKGTNWEETEENVRFARLCGHDCIVRYNEAWFASHLLYTQEGILDDKIPEERALGIESGFAWKEVADSTVVYVNRGISKGIHLGIRKTISFGQPFEYRVLPNYPNVIQSKILTLTGASGAGKTAIIRAFLKQNPESKLITSFTTRSPRDSDIPGEYDYNLPLEFFEERDKFLWVIRAHGNTYGTTKESVRAALSSDVVHLMILTPEAIPLLLAAIAEFGGTDNALAPFYVLSPKTSELERRLYAKYSFVKKRISDCQKWDREALASDVPYFFLSNDEIGSGVEKAVQQMLLFVQIM